MSSLIDLSFTRENEADFPLKGSTCAEGYVYCPIEFKSLGSEPSRREICLFLASLRSTPSFQSGRFMVQVHAPYYHNSPLFRQLEIMDLSRVREDRRGEHYPPLSQFQEGQISRKKAPLRTLLLGEGLDLSLEGMWGAQGGHQTI